ncbi:hypothetical protein AVEN_105329-1 [Araneus ventricosus]|uniref:Uncharacterized protein n=1 Tax=Araneus ventricosus TaxID=182803 RepID=A0A4Y2MXY3_ARAVE|nr:hypothetical protein AVEN_105329-1 [Araneus ventricosus]
MSQIPRQLSTTVYIECALRPPGLSRHETTTSIACAKNHHCVVDLPESEPAGVVSPKLSRILLEKGAVSPSVDKKIRTYCNPGSMTIRKYLGKESNSKRCVPISTLACSRTKSHNPPACTDCYQHACAWRSD